MFGAQAVNFQGFPRTTADLDLTIELGKLSPRTFVRQLDRAGFAARFSDDEFIAAARVIPVVHRATKLPVDLVLAGPGLEQRFLDEVELHRSANRMIPVLSVENLIVTKLLAGREKDVEDVRQLLARRKDIDSRLIVALLEQLDRALERSDLVAMYRRLRGG